MHFYHRCRHRFDGIQQGDGGVRISTRIQNDTIIIKADFVDFVDQLTFYIALEISDFTLRILRAQLAQLTFKRSIAVHSRFAFA